MPTERDVDAPQEETEGQAAAPREEVASEAREESTQEPGRLVWGLGAVGVFAVLAGVFAFLLDHWFDLSDASKFFLVGSLAVGSAFFAARAASARASLPRDLLLLFHSGMAFLMIWVVAAVYQLHGHPWRFFALSALLSLPGALIGKMVLLSDITAGFSFLAALLWLSDREWLGPLWGASLGMAFLCASLGLLSLAWRLRAQNTLGIRHGLSRALYRWGWTLLALPFVVASFSFSWPVYHPVPIRHWIPMAIFALAAFRFLPRILPEPRQSWERAAIFSGGLLLFGAVLTAGRLGDSSRQLLGFLLTSGFGLALMMTFASRKSRLGVALTIVALMLRISIFFLEQLELSSLSLLLVGALFCLVSFGVWRSRDTLFPQGEAAPLEPVAPARPLFEPFTQRRVLAALALAEVLVFSLWIAREELRQRDVEETELRQACEEVAPSSATPDSP